MRNHHGKPMFLTFLTFFNWGVSIGIVQLELSNENNAFRTQSCQLPQVNEVLTTYIYIIIYMKPFPVYSYVLSYVRL